MACIDLHQTGFAGKGSDHLQLIKFWSSCAPGSWGLRRDEKFWLRLTTASAQCLRLSERFFHWVLFSRHPQNGIAKHQKVTECRASIFLWNSPTFANARHWRTSVVPVVIHQLLTLNSFGSQRMIKVNCWPDWNGNDGWSLSSRPQLPPSRLFLTTTCSFSRGLKWNAISPPCWYLRFTVHLQTITHCWVSCIRPSGPHVISTVV